MVRKWRGQILSQSAPISTVNIGIKKTFIQEISICAVGGGPGPVEYRILRPPPPLPSLGDTTALNACEQLKPPKESLPVVNEYDRLMIKNEKIFNGAFIGLSFNDRAPFQSAFRKTNIYYSVSNLPSKPRKLFVYFFCILPKPRVKNRAKNSARYFTTIVFRRLLTVDLIVVPLGGTTHDAIICI